jgi:hypothetical protein
MMLGYAPLELAACPVRGLRHVLVRGTAVESLGTPRMDMPAPLRSTARGAQAINSKAQESSRAGIQLGVTPRGLP